MTLTMPRFLGQRSIRTQLVFWNIVALALLLAALGLFVRYLVVTTVMSSVDHQLDQRTQGMADDNFGDGPGGPGGPGGYDPGHGPNDQPGNDGSYRPPPSDNGFEAPADNTDPGKQGMSQSQNGSSTPQPNRHHIPHFMNSENRPRRFDLNGESKFPFASDKPWDGIGFLRAVSGETVYRTVTLNGISRRVISRPFPTHGIQQGVMQAEYTLTDVNRAVSSIDRALLIVIPIALLSAGLCGAFLTQRVLQRVRWMTQFAERLGGRDLSKRLPVTGRDEFAELAVTFNGLLGRLENAFEQQQRFTADASHELKTPLTTIRGTASQELSRLAPNSSQWQSMQEIDQAAETMASLVQDLLLLARSDGGQLGRNRIELLVSELLERVTTRIGRLTGVPIDLQLTGDLLCVSGNQDELGRLFSNLLDNAARFTPPDGRITVNASRQDEFVLVIISDTGIGIAPEHLAHLGERFYRVDSARARQDGGTGLGLSICRSIVDAHQGSISFESQVCVGTRVHVLLPVPIE